MTALKVAPENAGNNRTAQMAVKLSMDSHGNLTGMSYLTNFKTNLLKITHKESQLTAPQSLVNNYDLCKQ
jgi:hypothetical protein